MKKLTLLLLLGCILCASCEKDDDTRDIEVPEVQQLSYVQGTLNGEAFLVNDSLGLPTTESHPEIWLNDSKTQIPLSWTVKLDERKGEKYVLNLHLANPRTGVTWISESQGIVPTDLDRDADRFVTDRCDIDALGAHADGRYLHRYVPCKDQPIEVSLRKTLLLTEEVVNEQDEGGSSVRTVSTSYRYYVEGTIAGACHECENLTDTLRISASFVLLMP